MRWKQLVSDLFKDILGIIANSGLSDRTFVPGY